MVAWSLAAVALSSTTARAQSAGELVSAIEALERRRAPVELVAPYVSDSSGVVRARAITALGRMGDPRAAATLGRCLGEPDEGARRGAIHALGLLGSGQSLPALYAALRSSDSLDRVAAAAGIGLVCHADASLDDDARAGALAELVGLLESDASALRNAAALAIGFTGAVEGVSALDAQLHTVDPELRWRLVYAIGRLGGPAATAILARESARELPSAWCSEIAARFLAEDPSAAAVAPLAGLLRRSSVLVSAPAARGLAGREPAVAGPALTHALRSHPAALTRAEAARALGTVRPGASPLEARDLAARRSELERARVADPSAAVRAAAAAALAALEPERAPRLLERAAASTEREAIARALGAALAVADLAADTSEALFAQAHAILAGDEPALSIALARGIAPTQTGAAYDLLASMLGAQDPDLRAVAAAALARASTDPPQDMVGAFAQALASATGDEMGSARVSLVRLLGRTKSRAATASCQAALADPRREVRAAAAFALLAITDESLTLDGPIAPVPAFPGSDLPIPMRPVVVLETTKGDIEIALDPAAAPLRVRAFLHWVEKGYYAGRAVDLVVAGRLVQGGAPRAGGFGDAGVAIGAGHLGLPDEPSPLPFDAGAVGMPPAGMDAGGAALFFALAPAPELVGRCTRIGRVTRGLGTLDRLDANDRILVARRVR